MKVEIQSCIHCKWLKMARSILFTVCLSFLLLYKSIDCETWGDLSATLESNVGISLNRSSTKSWQPISISRIITSKPQNTTNTLEIPKIIEYQGRIASTPPKPGAPPKSAAPAATGVKTIKYRLGKRVAGKQIRFTK